MPTKPKTMTKQLEELLVKADDKISELQKFKEEVKIALSSNPPGKPPKFP